MVKEKIAVIFPGIGYHADKPLLYYSRKLAQAAGYRVIPVKYGPFPLSVKGDEEAMRACALEATAQAKEQLNAEELRKAETVFFSKSIGTVAAAAAAAELGISPAQIYYTPIAETFVHAAEGNGLVFHGTADPWVKTELVRERCEAKHLTLVVSEGANHSLETGDALRDLEILTETMRRVREKIV